MIPRNLIRLTLFAATALGLAVTLGACESATLKANEQQVQQQQAQIEQNQMEIQKMLAQQQGYGGGASSGSASAPIASAGGCDKSVMAEATRHGGDKLAAGDFTHAIGYYQDALTACPNDPRAELNLAHAYEAAGNRTAAIDHFRDAAHSTDPAESSAEEEARNALVRLGSN
ncbi:MAG: tetratricopeptide repeat protein [Candidatus Binataceae bacterium]